MIRTTVFYKVDTAGNMTMLQSLNIYRSVDIIGNNDNPMTISGNNSHQVINITDNIQVQLAAGINTIRVKAIWNDNSFNSDALKMLWPHDWHFPWSIIVKVDHLCADSQGH